MNLRFLVAKQGRCKASSSRLRTKPSTRQLAFVVSRFIAIRRKSQEFSISTRQCGASFEELDDVYAHLEMKMRQDDALPIFFDTAGLLGDVTYRDFL